MEWLRLDPLPPAHLLAWEEAFLEDTEAGGPERLWFWESPQPFVVVGYGQSQDREVHRSRCEALEIPVLRRCSGGGTVVQGPGCLSYGLTLRMDSHPDLATVSAANQWIMNRNASALNRLDRFRVAVRGHSDLVIQTPEGQELKVSGNAQRRGRHALLFHGTFLCNAHLELVSEVLPLPSIQPEYRANRAHATFITNLGVPADQLQTLLIQEWGALPNGSPPPTERYRERLTERYLIPGWHTHRKDRKSLAGGG